jgi:succinate dehydrogenase/fumarate reductase flavoprotein subunit
MDATDRARFAQIKANLERRCGALRDEDGLRASLSELHRLCDELKSEGRLQTFVGRAVLVALSVASSALARTESRGDHFRTDYPRRNDRCWLGNIRACLAEQGADVTLSYHRAGISTRTTAPMPAVNRG